MQDRPEEMRASVLMRARTLELQNRPVPTPAPDEVLIKVASVGVCGSDVHFYDEARLGDWVVESPLVLGHEASGTIVAAGDSVPSERIGQRVAIEPQRPSPHSPETLRGDYNLDPEMRFYAVPGVDGAFQEYVTIPAHFAFPVPDTISDDAAALMEPLSVAIATARKAALSPGQRVFISGAGPIGLITAQVARAYGVREVVVSDVSPPRRAAAFEYGATATLDPKRESAQELNVDAFIDASGVESAVREGILAVRSGGHAVLVGMGSAEMSLPVGKIMNKEINLTGVFRYTNTWPTAINLVTDGQVELDSLVTGHFGIEQVGAALESTRLPETLKSIVTPGVAQHPQP